MVLRKRQRYPEIERSKPVSFRPHPEINKALQRPVSKEAVDRLIKQKQAEISMLRGGTRAKAGYYQQAEEYCRQAGRTDLMYEINFLYKSTIDPEAFRKEVRRLLEQQGVL